MCDIVESSLTISPKKYIGSSRSCDPSANSEKRCDILSADQSVAGLDYALVRVRFLLEQTQTPGNSMSHG